MIIIPVKEEDVPEPPADDAGEGNGEAEVENMALPAAAVFFQQEVGGNAAGENASSSYRAVFQVKNTIPDETGPDVISNVVIAPETNYLQQRFYSTPIAGDYQLLLTFQYSTVASIDSSNPQPTIQATIKVPVKIVP